MLKKVRVSLLLVPAFLSLALVGACRKSEQSCENTTQCSEGFECSPAGICERPSADAAPPCPELTHFCAQSVPADWAGPVAGPHADRGNALAACSGDYATEVSVVGEGAFSAGACGCSCSGDAADLSCGSALLKERPSGSCFLCPVIGDACDSQSIPSTGACTSLNAALDDHDTLRISFGAVTDSGSCAAPLVDNTLEADFASQERYCQAESLPASCPDSAQCLPLLAEPDYGPLCIYRAGDHDCPALYPAKELRFDQITDDRSCTACSCSGPAVGSSCGGTVSIGLDGNCSDNGQYATTQCITNPATLPGTKARYNPAPDSTCVLAGGEQEGVVLLSGETTYCCTDAIADPSL